MGEVLSFKPRRDQEQGAEGFAEGVVEYGVDPAGPSFHWERYEDGTTIYPERGMVVTPAKPQE